MLKAITGIANTDKDNHLISDKVRTQSYEYKLKKTKYTGNSEKKFSFPFQKSIDA